MKTAEEIKKGLDHCGEDGCKDCPYVQDCTMTDGFSELARDSLAYIQQLEAENERLQRYYEAEADRAADSHHNMLEAEASVPRWIPVEERLPETQTTVMLALKRDGGGIRIAIGYRAHWTPARYYIDGGNCAVDENRVTHWMPLPEPPEVNKP